MIELFPFQMLPSANLAVRPLLGKSCLTIVAPKAIFVWHNFKFQYFLSEISKILLEITSEISAFQIQKFMKFCQSKK